MFPSFELFDRTISMYALCALAGIFAVLLLTYKLAEKRGLDEFEMLYMMLFSFVGVLVFSHILYAFTKIDAIVFVLTHLEMIKTFDDFVTAVSFIFGGSVFYGGLIGAIIVFVIYTKIRKLNFGDYSDLGALAIPLFHFFGRIGCFLSGCCYGIEWKYGFVYENSLVESANHVPRFPVQLVEAAFNLFLFFLLFYLYKKRKARRKLIAVYLTAYPACRFVLEFFRGDTYRGFIGMLSTSQIISVILFITGVSWLALAHFKKNRKEPIKNVDNNNILF